MSQQLNFAELKRRISPLKGAEFLKLDLNYHKSDDSHRCACPVCDTDDPRSLSIKKNDKGVYTFKCFKDGISGSAFDLVCHVRGIGLVEAANWINRQESEEWTNDYDSATPKDPEEATKLSALQKLPKLDPQHEEIAIMGMDARVASETGVGFCSVGLMRGCVAIPLYSGGSVIGFVGIPAGTTVKLPKNLMVVS